MKAKDGESFFNGRVVLHPGDCRKVLKSIPDCSIDSIVTDPPYALVSITKRFGKNGAAPAKVGKTGAYARASAGFMGKQWDTGEAAFAIEFWAECLRVLKPGGHVAAFGGTRTYHRLACAIEDAGFEIRDQIGWAYGSGFPKSHDVSKGIDRAAGAERALPNVKPMMKKGAVGEISRNVRCATCGKARASGNPCVCARPENKPATDAAREWEGWGTALKPAWEPICLARKPLSEPTVAANVLRWRTGALNIDGCRVGTEETLREGAGKLWSHYRDGEASAERRYSDKGGTNFAMKPGPRGGAPEGRWPANVVHDGSAEVVAAFPADAGAFAPVRGTEPSNSTVNVYGARDRTATLHHGDSGSAARFFYSAKADSDDRLGSKHPTVKPVDLIQWLERLITPPGGVVLDPFAGTGTAGEAAFREGFRAILVERETEYCADVRRRMALCLAGPDERARESIKAKTRDLPADHGPLFAALSGLPE